MRTYRSDSGTLLAAFVACRLDGGPPASGVKLAVSPAIHDRGVNWQVQSHEILAVLHNDEAVDIYARTAQWRRIAPSQEQWVHGSLIRITGGGGDDALVRITQIAAASSIASFNWPQRGVAPIGYFKGMAITFARAVCKLRANDPVAVEMAKAATGSATDDSLVHYSQKFANLGMDNSVAGVDTLRHLFGEVSGFGK